MLTKTTIAKNLFYFSCIVLGIIFFTNLFFIYRELVQQTVNASSIIGLLLIGLVSVLGLCMLIISYKLSGNFYFAHGEVQKPSKLRKRIITAFSIGAALPTVLVAVFSTYFFNFGIEAWFDKKISRVLDQSVIVGESYIAEHVLQLTETAISVSKDLSSMYYDLIHNSDLFTNVINAQAELRSFDEAIVFQKSSNTVLAQTSLSFSLSFITIPQHLIEKADRGGAVQIESSPYKIRILIRLKDFKDTYLLIGRLVDPNIIDHINKTTGAVHEYEMLKKKIIGLQIKFSMVFILLSLVLVLTAIIWGEKFAGRIVKPIRELVIAAEKVKDGDFNTQVPIQNLKNDEVRVLSCAFNRMVNQIDRQNKELLIAQRAIAWSDVARRIAHEIKNPLTPIQLSAERLSKKFNNEVSDPESFKKYIRNILKNAADISQIVSEFVEFARLPAPNFTNCEIISLIHDLVESRQLINNNINYLFISNVDKYRINCDVSQINRVMVNLLLNAEESFINFDKTKIRTIYVKVNITNENLIILIEDNGPGFSQEMLTSAKEAYVTTKSQGTGLGLSIVDRIITDHFGKLEIDNTSAGGARVRIKIDSLKLNEYVADTKKSGEHNDTTRLLTH
ncbi:MAG: ATP-binding protein [Rickettsiaceae bacterium]